MALSVPIYEDLDDEEFLLLSRRKNPKKHSIAKAKIPYKTLYLPFDFDLFTNEECWVNFRFQRPDIFRLKNALGIPDIMRGYNGTRVAGLEGLLILLRRLSYPNRLGPEICTMFGKNEPEVSIIINEVLDFIYARFSHLLSGFGHPWLSSRDISVYTRAVSDHGAPMDRCWGFIDGTARAICRPGRDQKMFFSGHKRMHCIKFQSIQTPNGLVVNLFGPLEGTRHDSAMFAESGVAPSLEAIRDENGNTCYVYGDQGYALRPYLMAPFGGNNLTADQREFNRAMSVVRQSVEWGFGGVLKDFAFLDFKKNLKLFLQPIGKYYIVGTLLYNCRACLYGNEISQFFELVPPTLEQYLRTE